MGLTTTAPTTLRLDVAWSRQPDAEVFSKQQAIKIGVPKLSGDDSPYVKLFNEMQRKHPGRQLHLVQSERTLFLEVAVMHSGISLAFYCRKYRNDPELMLYVL